MSYWFVGMSLCYRKRSKELFGKVRLVRKKVKGVPKKGKVKFRII